VISSSLENIGSSFTDLGKFIPSITQFIVNAITVLILSFYLILDKNNLNRKFFAILPKKYHENARFAQRAVNKSFASFVRVQVLWGVIGGALTWVVLAIFGVPFAGSTSLVSGILTAVPVIGPIIGVIPPLLVSLIEKPDQAIIIFLVIFGIQQFIFNAIGPKIIGRAFNLNPVIVILSLLIGIKIAGATGAIFAIPIVSIILIVGKELYDYYFKERED
jgi:predicted PurR-regulated permease PerM